MRWWISCSFGSPTLTSLSISLSVFLSLCLSRFLSLWSSLGGGRWEGHGQVPSVFQLSAEGLVQHSRVSEEEQDRTGGDGSTAEETSLTRYISPRGDISNCISHGWDSSWLIRNSCFSGHYPPLNQAQCHFISHNGFSLFYHLYYFLQTTDILWTPK